MTRLAVFLLILGAGSFMLPLFGLQFRLLDLFGDSQQIVAIVMVIAGVALLVVDRMRAKAPTRH